nr:hypothetical protein [Salinispora arenicola]
MLRHWRCFRTRRAASEQLRARITASARYQEGETPAEDASALLAEAGEALGELESLIRRINRTNAATVVREGAHLPTRSRVATCSGCGTAWSRPPQVKVSVGIGSCARS